MDRNKYLQFLEFQGLVNSINYETGVFITGYYYEDANLLNENCDIDGTIKVKNKCRVYETGTVAEHIAKATTLSIHKDILYVEIEHNKKIVCHVKNGEIQHKGEC